MKSLVNDLVQLISSNVTFCGMCLKNVEDEYFSLIDVASFTCSENVIEVEISKVLKYVLGPEYLQNLSTEILCRNCLSMSINCYKFVITCKENSKNIHNLFENIERINLCEEGMVNYKTMYLILNKNTFLGTEYYDQISVSGNRKEAFKRLEFILDQPDMSDQSSLKEPECNKLDHLEYVLEGETVKPTNKNHLVPTGKMVNSKNHLSLFKCNECNLEFSRSHNLKRHVFRIHASKDFVCSICNKCFGALALLDEHKLQSHSGKGYVCFLCGKNYATRSSLKLHETSHETLKCDACGKCYKNKRRFKNHIELKQCNRVWRRKDLEKKYVCDYCNKKYVCKGTLRVHIQFDHGNGCHHICSWCGKKFWSSARLKAHTVKHTQEKNFRCEICGGCYVTKESLLYHTRTHTGEKPYQCDHCNQRFLSTSRLSEHTKQHHMDPILECDICFSKLRGRSCLLRHKKRHLDPNSKLFNVKLGEKKI